MKCDHCGYYWIAVAPLSAIVLECPSCHKMTSLDCTSVEYAIIDLRFTYFEDDIPETGIAVLGAWTNDDEFHVTPSVWDGSKWLDHDRSFALDDDYHLYAWAEWPIAPPLRQQE